METSFSYIDENYKKIVFNVEEAKAKYRKPDEKIDIMAVTKTVSPENVNHALSLGINLIGENKVQEYLSKKDFYNQTDVHFIGHLQTNKVKYIIEDMKLIQSVDNIKLAAEIDKHAKRIGKIQDILLEVNVGEEDSKSGISPSEIKDLVHQASEFSNIRVKGLMTIPPISENEYFFDKMQKIYIDICEENIDNINMSVLSMGMSADYVSAIKHGSTMVRIGSALFGARIYK